MVREITLSRRGLLKAMGAVAGAACLSDGSAFAQASGAGKLYAPDLREPKVYQGCCNPECLGHSLNMHVVDGKVIRCEPKKLPDDPLFTTGCARGIARMQALNDSARVLRPLKRVRKNPNLKSYLAPDGDRFVSVSWEQAISEIAVKLKEVVGTPGEIGFSVSTASGNMGPVKNAATTAFFDYLEKPRTGFNGSLCCVAVSEGMADVFGVRRTDTRETIKDSLYILNWGNNPAITSQTWWKHLVSAKRAGAKIATIDPRYSESCGIADQWVKIVPGTDVLLAIGMVKYIINNNLYDADFLLSKTNAPLIIDVTDVKSPYTDMHKSFFYMPDGKHKMICKGKVAEVTDNTGGSQLANFDAGDLDWEGVVNSRKLMTVFRLMRHLYAGETLLAGKRSDLFDTNYTYAYISKTTGVPKADIERLARDYATAGGTNSKKAMIIQNMSGAQRIENGVSNVQIQCHLTLLTGQIGGIGNGIDDTGGFNNYGLIAGAPLVTMPAQKEFYIPRTNAGIRQLAAHKGKAMKSVDDDSKTDPKVRFWWISTHNVTTQFPDTGALKEAMRYIDCVVSVKPYPSTDSDMADYVLPVASVGECWDISNGSRNNYVQISEKAVEPYGEAKSDTQVMRMLAKEVWSGENPISPVTFTKNGVTYNKIEQFDKEDYDFVKQCFFTDDGKPRSMGGVTWDRLVKEKTIRPNNYAYPLVPHKNGVFTELKTQAQRGRLYFDGYSKDSAPNSAGYRADRSLNPANILFRSPLPRYVPASESQLPFLPQFKESGKKGELINGSIYRAKYPLMAIQVKVSHSIHATFLGFEWIREAYGDTSVVMIHPADAKKRGIINGDRVRVLNDRGAINRVAKVTEFVQQGVVTLENGWSDHIGSGSSSYVTNNNCEPLAKGHICNSTLVEIRKI